MNRLKTMARTLKQRASRIRQDEAVEDIEVILARLPADEARAVMHRVRY